MYLWTEQRYAYSFTLFFFLEKYDKFDSKLKIAP